MEHASPMPPPPVAVLNYEATDRRRGASRWMVLAISVATPGLASLLLLGHPRARWASLLLGTVGVGWAVDLVVFQLLYPRTHEPDPWLLPLTAVTAVAVVASVSRGLADRRRLIASGSPPAAPRWVFLILSLLILVVALMFLAVGLLMLFAMAFMSWPK